MELKQIAAFAEYVIKPMGVDVREILDTVRKLNIPISTNLVKTVAMQLWLANLIREVIRGLTYIGVTWILAQAAAKVLAAYP